MVLHYFVHHRQAKSGAVFLAIADKWMKQTLTNRFGDARAVVGNRNRERARDCSRRDFHLASDVGGGLTGVQQQVIQSAFQLARIEPARDLATAQDVDPARMVPRM